MYNTNTIVVYSTDDEYRNCLKKVLNVELVDNDNILSEYDESTSKELDDIYEKTKNHPLFKIIYEKAANRFLSTDLEIGLAVLFSFSYFDLFHLLLCDFLQNTDFDNSNVHYSNLLNDINKK